MQKSLLYSSKLLVVVSRVGHRVRDGSWRILAFGSLRQFVEWFYTGGAGSPAPPAGKAREDARQLLEHPRVVSKGCLSGA